MYLVPVTYHCSVTSIKWPVYSAGATAPRFNLCKYLPRYSVVYICPSRGPWRSTVIASEVTHDHHLWSVSSGLCSALLCSGVAAPAPGPIARKSSCHGLGVRVRGPASLSLVLGLFLYPPLLAVATTRGMTEKRKVQRDSVVPETESIADRLQVPG